VTERDHAGGGGLTGATGDLTYEENDRPFVTGEAREASDPERQADVTAAQIRRAPAQQGEAGDPRTTREDGRTELATRGGGYATAHGLSPEDPAYRMERHPSAGEQTTSSDDRAGRADRDPRIGGDEITDREEHL
jgi:hypothetical protein